MLSSAAFWRLYTYPLPTRFSAVALAVLKAMSALWSRVIKMAKWEAKPCFLISIVVWGPEMFTAAYNVLGMGIGFVLSSNLRWLRHSFKLLLW